jgi:TfoX/Sxy family transcriptional regulator of competence genes
MASDQEFVDYVCDQVRAAGSITFRKMFGEYALYCDGKVVALICDNQLFVKPTAAGREKIASLGPVVEGQPYPGAKPYFLIDSQLDDQEWMADLIRATAAALPLPKPRKPRKTAD